MNIDNWASIFNTIENKLTESGMLKTIKEPIIKCDENQQQFNW